MASASVRPTHKAKSVEYTHATILVPSSEKPIFELSDIPDFMGDINNDFMNKALIPKEPSDTKYMVVVVKHGGKYYLKTLDDQRAFEMPASGRIDDLSYPSDKELALIPYDAGMFDVPLSCDPFKGSTVEEFKKSFEIKKYLYSYFNETNTNLRNEKKDQLAIIPNYLFVPFYDERFSLTILLYNNVINEFIYSKIGCLKNQNTGKITDTICFNYKYETLQKNIKPYRFSSVVGLCIPPSYFYYKQLIGGAETSFKEYIHKMSDLVILDKCPETSQGGGSSLKKSRKTQKRHKKTGKSRNHTITGPM